MAAHLGLAASGSVLDGMLVRGVPAGDVLDEFIADLDQQLSDNQTQSVLLFVLMLVNYVISKIVLLLRISPCFI